VEHPVLGVLKYDESVDAWRCVVPSDPSSLGFLVAGKNTPDERLLAHAVSIVEGAAGFFAAVQEFLVSEAIKQPKWANEIEGLKVQEICLFWPRRPDDGMVYFATPTEVGRLWHADYIKRRLVGLGFDS
jgi:hypothetical protein